MENLKAVIYARYSSSSQREESIEGQIRECTAFAERNGYTIIGLTLTEQSLAQQIIAPIFKRWSTTASELCHFDHLNS